MRDLISAAILIAALFGGTLAANKIYCSVRNAALTKAGQGLPGLSAITHSLTKRPKK